MMKYCMETRKRKKEKNTRQYLIITSPYPRKPSHRFHILQHNLITPPPPRSSSPAQHTALSVLYTNSRSIKSSDSIKPPSAPSITWHHQHTTIPSCHPFTRSKTPLQYQQHIGGGGKGRRRWPASGNS